MDDPAGPLLLLISLILTACYQAVNQAYSSSSKIRLKNLKELGNLEEDAEDSADILKDIQDIFEDTDKVHIGIDAAIAFFSAVSVILFTNMLKLFFRHYMLASVILSPLLLLIFTVLTPKKLAKFSYEFILEKFHIFIRISDFIFAPMVYVTDKLTDFLTRLIGVKKDFTAPLITQDDLKALVDFSGKEGFIEENKTNMIQNIFEFSDLTVSDVMVQRMDIVAVDINDTFDEVLAAFKSKKLSRIPVYEDTIDEIKGFLYSKDLFYAQVGKNRFSLKNLLRPAYYTHEFVKIPELFEALRRDGSHIAIVLDEYGGVAGLITMEDVLESIVGDIYDEYDIEEKDVIALSSGEYIINAGAKLEDIEETLGIDLVSDDYESLGGYIIEQNDQKFPYKGQIIETDKLKLTVLEVNKNRIGRVKAVIKKTAGEHEKQAEAPKPS